MSKPIVAIVGRANVGKSTFFNRVCGKRISIVDDVAGVTRDRIYADAEWCGHFFTLIDTGGIDFTSDDIFQKNIQMQAKMAIDSADVIIFMVDGRTSVTSNDEQVASILRKSRVPVILAVNKLDNFDTSSIYEYYSLGLGEPMPISSVQGKGIGDLLDVVVANFPKIQNIETDGIKIAVVGRPNVGKSSLVNTLLGENRVVVSKIEGTTRDAVMVPFRYNKQNFYLVDTAGLRRQRGVEKASVEGYSVLRSLSAIDEADVVLVVLDFSKSISEQDVKIAGLVHEAGKPSVIVVNKFDLKENSKEKFLNELKNKLSFMSYFQVVFLSALTKARIGELMPIVLKVFENASRRIKTGLLNEVLQDAILNYEPPAKNGKRAKIYYVTQTQTNPPTFVFFCNDAKLINFAYEHYLENRIREKLEFFGTPIKIIIKSKEEK